jgi:hypothetical protein
VNKVLVPESNSESNPVSFGNSRMALKLPARRRKEEGELENDSFYFAGAPG